MLKNIITPFIFIITFLVVSLKVSSQSVGLVLSGGGSSGIAHIGVIMALEEDSIPINYITGTSMGALVGAMYVSGYTPQEMIEYFSSDEYQNKEQGDIDEKHQYSFKRNDKNSSWITIKLESGEPFTNNIPTNLISPINLDLELLKNFAGPSAAAGYNFDSLLIPFRCVASDIAAKESYKFEGGDLTQAVRASIAYPFYLKPLLWNNRLLFDGGMYNNFPVNVMKEDFAPEYIIGSSVASNLETPDEDDLISQVKNMFIIKQEFEIDKKDGIIIKPKTEELGLFDFKNVLQIVNKGYVATKAKIPEIKTSVKKKENPIRLIEQRNKFKKSIPPILIDKISIKGLNKNQSFYVQRTIQEKPLLGKKRNRPLTMQQIEKKYYGLFEDEDISSIYPWVEFDKQSGLYNLNLKVKKEKEIFIDFGGNFSSRPINIGYIGVQYNHLGRFSINVLGNSFFGKFYGSAHLGAKVNFPMKRSFYLYPSYTLNRWDYFRSGSTFFEDSKPSYIIQNESFANLTAGWPFAKKGRVKFGLGQGNLKDSYYQSKDFTTTDTADVTNFDFTSAFLHLERNSLNHKQYANSGAYLGLKIRYNDGLETTIPGSTSADKDNIIKSHYWWKTKITYDNYYKSNGFLRLGIYIEGVISTQPLFANYTASIIKAPVFSPTPYSKSLFLETFRATQYIALGHKFIFDINNNFDLRIEGYVFQPYKGIVLHNEGSFEESENLEKRYTIATATAVYHSPLGPLSFGFNYFLNVPEVTQEDREPINFVLNFGYILFNKKAID